MTFDDYYNSLHNINLYTCSHSNSPTYRTVIYMILHYTKRDHNIRLYYPHIGSAQCREELREPRLATSFSVPDAFLPPTATLHCDHAPRPCTAFVIESLIKSTS